MMHRTHVWRNLSPLPLLLAIVLAAGCSSQTQGQKMVESYAKTRDTLAESQTQVEITLAAMQHVRATPGERVHEAYRQYEDAVDALEKQAKDAAFRAKSMKEESDEHIRSWQEEMKSIKDRSIKASLESRRDAVRSNFKLIQMYADDVRKAYEPFVQGNRDIVQALSIDLSPAAISSLAGSMDRVVADGEMLTQKIALMQIAMTNIANGISPLGGMK